MPTFHSTSCNNFTIHICTHTGLFPHTGCDFVVAQSSLPLIQDDKVCLGELTGFSMMVEDELLHGTSAVIAIEGDLDLQVCSSHT